MTTLRKLVKNDMKIYPYNDKFNFDYAKAQILQNISPGEFQHDTLSEVVKLLPFFNGYYTGTYSYMKKNFFEANIDFEQLINLFFVIFNRNYLILTRQMIERFKGKAEWRQQDFFSYKTKVGNGTTPNIEAAAIVELDVDAMNYALNYVQYFADSTFLIDQTKPAVRPIEIGKRLHAASSMFSNLKEQFDESIWNGGYWQINNKGNKPVLNLVFEDTELLIINKVGLIRFQRNISSNFFAVYGEVQRETSYGKIIRKAVESKRQNKRLKAVLFQNGFIDFKLAKGSGKKDVITELRNYSAYITYYPFLENVKFSSLADLELMDLIKLFSLLQELLDEVSEVDFDDSIFSMNDILKFPIKITEQRLLDYFSQRTTYAPRQIRSFLKLISFPLGERINFWDRPLVLYKRSYYFNFLATINPIVLNLLDYWIEKAGYSLDQRGTLLEKYLKNELTSILKSKKVEYYIPAVSKIYNSQKKFEEIDLIVNLKEVLLVAEIKCIKYPLEPRDRHNSIKTLTKAVKQIKRKIEFLKKWEVDVSPIIGEFSNKEIVPLVITNYPTYSGYSIEGVSVCDFYLLESYFKSGKMTNSKVYKDWMTETSGEHWYYKSETQMNHNLKSFFSSPYPVEEIKQLFEIVDFKLTLEEFPYDVYVTSAQFKDQAIDHETVKSSG
jgi:hypothetical protein